MSILTYYIYIKQKAKMLYNRLLRPLKGRTEVE
jgi:hypothetical protein